MSMPGRRAGRRGARPLGEIMRGLLRRKKFREKGKYGALVDAWCELVGEAIAARTGIRSFKDGELVIEVDSSALLHELNSFMKQQLLQGLRESRGGRDVAALRLCLSARKARPGLAGPEQAEST
ncbi:MAG: DUF721 domain-containing protein [Candidatus Brocadiae bacterium]|nr:DUF721 domain-containing protein [Candidatus Brocadiia bacterium]